MLIALLWRREGCWELGMMNEGQEERKFNEEKCCRELSQQPLS